MGVVVVPRGLRNHNPLNIRLGEKPWLGELRPGGDGSFCVFKSDAYGYRAAFKLLHIYRTRHGVKSLREVISRWAPPAENDTRGYLGAVCKLTGMDADRRFDPENRAMAVAVVKAMSQVENGRRAVDADVDEGWALWKEYP